MAARTRAKTKGKPAARPGAAHKKTSLKKSAPARGKSKKVVLLAGGNPQISKGDGDAPVQAYIAAMPGWKRDIGKRIDELVVRLIPKVRKAVKWNSPFYGVESNGWFLAEHVFTHFVRVTFFKGAALDPLPPGPSKAKDVRYYDIRENSFDEKQMASWIRQAAKIPGWLA